MIDNMMRDRRIELGRKALKAGRGDVGEKGTELVDVLANLMHYAGFKGLDFSAALDTATMHYEAEKA